VAGAVDRRLGRPSVPVPTLLRLLYLKHRYQLGYQSLCREVADSIAWRRFCRIPLDQPVPHPTTLSKLVGRAGPQVLGELNAALLAKLAAGKLLRCRKLRVDTTVIAADIDHPTDADLLEHAVRILGGLVGRIHERGAATRTRFRDRSRAAGRRLKQISRTLRRRTGQAPAEIDRLTAEVAAIARQTVAQGPSRSPTTPAARLPPGPATAACDGWSAGWTRRPRQPAGCLTRPASGLPATASSPTGWSRWPTGRPPDPQGQAAAADRVRRHRAAGRVRARLHRHPHTHKGNPGDPGQLVPAVTEVIALTGRPPGTVVGDRGFGTAANDIALAVLGVQRIGIARKGTPGKARAAVERTRRFKRMRNWRGRHPGPHQPPQALVRVGSHPAAPPGRRDGLGGAGNLRLQPAAHECDRRMRPPAARSVAATTPHPPQPLSRPFS
jgi:IS5 family transposase